MLKREKCGFGGRSGRELRRGIINPSGKWRESSCYCSKKPSIFGEKTSRAGAGMFSLFGREIPFWEG